MSWQNTLQNFLAACHAPLQSEHILWAVIGSAASALQGCQHVPGDIDILAQHPDGIFRMAELMRPYAPEHAPFPLGSVEWLSSHETPLSIGPDGYGSVWHFTRWIIDGVKVEAAHIQPREGFAFSDQGGGIWEAGPEIWAHLRSVNFAGFQVPVVPLEIQLQTNRARNLVERTHQIETILREHGCDQALLKMSLAQVYRAEFADLLEGTGEVVSR